MFRTAIVSCGLALWMLGCGTSVTYAPMNAAPRPPTPKKSALEVEVFTTQVPSRPYVEVFSMEGQKESQYSSAESADMIAAMRAKAAELGCDGLVTGGVTRSEATATGGNSATATIAGRSAVCIMYR